MRWEADAPQSFQPSISTPQTCQRIPCLQLHISAAQTGKQGKGPGFLAIPLVPPTRTSDTQARAVRAHLLSSPGREPKVASPPLAVRSSSSACSASSCATFAAWSMALAAWVWLQSTEGACQKRFPHRFSPPTSFTVAFSDAGSHPLGKHSVSVKGTCILLAPPAPPKDRGALGRAEALCSNWTSKGKL